MGSRPDTPEDFVRAYERLASESIWMPARINGPDGMDNSGTINNATQAYIRMTGAYKGESNFKKQQVPARHGYVDETSLGTYVMNMHQEIDVLKQSEIAIDAKVIRLGRWIKREHLTPQDRILAGAARAAAKVLKQKHKLDKTQPPIQRVTRRSECRASRERGATDNTWENGEEKHKRSLTAQHTENQKTVPLIQGGGSDGMSTSGLVRLSVAEEGRFNL